MDKDIWDILIKLALACFGAWTLFYKRAEILGYLHKDYTAKLDSTVRFFEQFYKKEAEKRLTLDRAAQELVRSDFVNYDLVVYLIKLHELRLINFDQLMKLYKFGRKFLIYTNKDIVSSDAFTLKIKKGRKVKKQIKYWNIQYAIFASLFLFPLVFWDIWLKGLLNQNLNVIAYIYLLAYFVGSLILAFLPLLQSNDLKHAEDFIAELKEADEQYNEYEVSERMIHGIKEAKIIGNISEYKRNRY
ncbi:hypothetical protein [Acinetobacter sp. KS-LM10]|uniref:hypothetical protein n=1 Tax=Acinetobacter sp. KS-LM10 TaxID=3120518 RepID=UPI0030D1398E